MYIKPNEFDVQLAAARAVAPAYKRPHRAAGAAFLLILGPVLAAWLALLACWVMGVAIVRALGRVTRFLPEAADYGGWLVLR